MYKELIASDLHETDPEHLGLQKVSIVVVVIITYLE